MRLSHVPDAIRIRHWRHAADGFRTLGYPFRCEGGSYDLYLRQTGYWPSIYSLVRVRVDDGPWVEYQKYRMLSAGDPNSPAILKGRRSPAGTAAAQAHGTAAEGPPGDWCMVMRAELTAGEHTMWVHQPMEPGYCPLFLFDHVELRPTATTATDWRWGVSEGYRSGLAGNRRIRATVRTADEARRYQERVRANFERTVGPMPERGELRSRTTGVTRRAGFAIERLWFQSRPGFYVTANLYLPDDVGAPLPAVLYLPGHSPNGKANEPYQVICQCLARKGYAVLNIDPLGQGERGPYYAPGNNHECQGIQGFLPRDLNPQYFIWDGVRAIDYLQGRPEVDGTRIAVTGISGGGVQTMLLAACDRRVTGAVAMGSVVQMECLLWSSYDPDGTFDDGIREYGCTTADLVACIAPRGFVIQNGAHDPGFPVGSGHRVYQDVKGVWSAFGAEDQIACDAPDAGHEVNRAMRRNVYRWLNRWLDNEAAGLDDPPVEVLDERDLQVTASGLVDTDFADAESVWSLRTAIVERQAGALERRRRDALASPDRARSYAAEVRDALRGVLKIGSPSRDRGDVVRVAADRAPGDRAPEGDRASGSAAERMWFDTEPPMRISADLRMPAIGEAPAARAPALVYLNQRSTGPDAAWLEPVLGSGWAVLAVHARCNRVERGTSAVYAGRYPLAMKAADLLRAAEVLRACDGIDPERLIYVGADGHAGIAALFAALLDERAGGAAACTLLASFREFLFDKACRVPDCAEIAFLPGALSGFDIPDLAAALAPRPLLLMGARRSGLGFAGRLYGTMQADDRHTPGPDVSELSADVLCRWLDRLDR
jgi:cephalosporin-C deacetylase-like acetyl esterase